MKKLSEEQEKFAKSIGATHFFMEYYWKGGGTTALNASCPFRWDYVDGWVLSKDYRDVDDPASDWHKDKIDFRDSCDMKHGDFQFAVERLVEYCNNSGIVCDELDVVERMLKEM